MEKQKFLMGEAVYVVYDHSKISIKKEHVWSIVSHGESDVHYNNCKEEYVHNTLDNALEFARDLIEEKRIDLKRNKRLDNLIDQGES